MTIETTAQAALAAQAEAEKQKARESAGEAASGVLDGFGVVIDVAGEFAAQAAIGTAKVACDCVAACLSGIADAL